MPLGLFSDGDEAVGMIVTVEARHFDAVCIKAGDGSSKFDEVTSTVDVGHISLCSRATSADMLPDVFNEELT